MRIGVISDTHGDVLSWSLALDIFKDVEYVIHAGDILYHGPFNPILPTYNPMKLAEKLNKSPVPIIFARGNCDSSVDTLALEYPIQNPYAFIFAEGLRIMVNHGDTPEPANLVDLANRYRIDIVITGHTHAYQLERAGKVILLNPGSPSIPKGKKIPTVAVIDIKGRQRKIEIVNVALKDVITLAEF